MNIFHCRSNLVPRRINLELFCKLAILADYYFFPYPLFARYADAWFGNLLDDIEGRFPTMYNRDLMLWLYIGSACRSFPRELENLGSIAIRQSKYRIATLGLPFRGSLIANLNDKRENAIGQILDTFESMVGCMICFNVEGNCHQLASSFLFVTSVVFNSVIGSQTKTALFRA